MATAAIPITPIQRPPMEEPTAKGLPPELEDKLKAPLPPEAITSNDKHSHLSSIKPAYVIERMNEVFGIGGYHTTYTVLSHEKVSRIFKKGTPQQYEREQFVGTVQGFLDIPKYGIHLENFGGSENDDLGDALKGAATDAFTKNCSLLGVGLDVYKGKYDKESDAVGPNCPNPNCGKPLRKSRESDEYFCWKKRGGCGATFTPEALEKIKKSTQQSGVSAQPKPVQSAQAGVPVPHDSRHPQQSSPAQPRASVPHGPSQAQPANPDKITIEGLMTNLRNGDGLLRVKVGERECATRTEDLIGKLKRIGEGKIVELLVSELTGPNGGKLHQIHKVIGYRGGAR